MTSEKPASGLSEEPEPPPPPDEIEPEPPKAPPPVDENAWVEDYDEHIVAEEPKPRKPRKKRRWGGIIVIVIVLVALLLWTILSPKVVPQSGDTYLRSDQYASLNGYAGNVDTYAGNATWAISVGGDDTATSNAMLNLSVLVTKVQEETSSFWFRGMAIELRNASIYDDNGTFLAKMSEKTDIGFGPLATIHMNFAEPKDYELKAYVKFLVYADMRIGFLPVKVVEIWSEPFTIHVS